MKKFFDVIFALIGLMVLTPLFILIGFAIKLDDRGAVFFRQERIGRNGKPFMLFKFRSMSPTEGAGRGIFIPGDSSRITRTGKVLRKTKLDELPQLLNVLKGDMSLVGPRPEVQKWVDVYPERWQKVLSVKPGITDNASIEYRYEEELLANSDDPGKTYREVILPRKLALYEDYVTKHTLLGDLKLIINTIKHIFKRPIK